VEGKVKLWQMPRVIEGLDPIGNLPSRSRNLKLAFLGTFLEAEG